MNILIVAATPAELEPWEGAGTNSDILITGVGTVATAYQFTRKVRLKEYRLVIQAGLAGAFDDATPLGEVVTVRSDRFSDRLLTEKGQIKPLSETDLMPGDEFPFWEGRLVNPNPLIAELPYRQVAGITSDSITDDPQMIDFFRKNFTPDIESMEGAAFHYVCLMEDVPFLQIRAISNHVGERDKSRWEAGLAISNLNKALKEIVQKMQ